MLLVGLATLPNPLQAQPWTDRPIRPLAAVRADSAGQFIEDKLGDTLRVTGRASTGTETYYSNQLTIFIQSTADTTGLLLFSPALQTPVAVGDSVDALGVVEAYNGMTQFRVLDYRVVSDARTPPTPLELTVAEAAAERYQGLLAHVHGRVINKRSNRGGQYLIINDPGSSDAALSVFLSNHQLRTIDLDAYEVGDEIAVTGVLSQYDYKPPFDSYYQIRPRTQKDLRTLGLPARFYRRAAVIGLIVLLLAIGTAVLFRRQVRKRTQQLADSKARFRRLAEATFEGIVIHEDNRILDVNEPLLQMLGCTREEVENQPVSTFLDADSCRPIESREAAVYEATLLRKDAPPFPAEIAVKHLPFDGRNVHVAAVRDITKQKKHEQQILHAKAQAENVARLKSSLLNNMSHELRTPITSIIGYAELIMSEPPPLHEEFAKRIKRSGKRLGETLNSVLEMAQIESGTLSLDIARVDVGALADEVTNLYRSSITDKPVTLQVETAPGTLAIHSDRRFLYRILSNLVSNAVKFTEEGTIAVRIAPTPDGISMEVRDTGIGITSAFKSELFDAFKQESQGFGRSYEGTGLGLTITKRMVELLDGEIHVESTRGEGSTFTVTIPDAASEEMASPPVAQADASANAE